ncbi:SDR family NAD(P)-dependent oxidoreductase [Actinomycetospora straminea]|uniref:SDR family oxidoreductase n=1 Tax=Actinomycetospora straminea TaxID=663607 RepID=A0ABP9ECT1_9PSEU|nr:SDR family oxidoreductase [Actinomycetospora straminea]MDD7934491.1 SDR family oxidoreductase [Actinomycetospora straminea]
MDLQLRGKRVLVTGASRGLGLEIVRAFLAEGSSVVATARRSTPEIEATGATFLPADLTAPDGPRRVVEAALAADPRLDVLVNNAGGGEMPTEPAVDVFDGEDDVWAAAFALNLDAARRTTRAALPALTEARGAVVTISSDSARRVGPEPLPYRVAKAALNAFSRSLAERVAPSGVRVNTVSPAGIRTPLLTGPDTFVARMAADMGLEHETLLAAMPQQNGMLTGELIEPAEVARVVLLLASPTVPSVIGADWAVDAGSVKVG